MLYVHEEIKPQNRKVTSSLGCCQADEVAWEAVPISTSNIWMKDDVPITKEVSNIRSALELW